MRDRLIDGLIQGDRGVWAAVGLLWALAAIVVLLHRPAPEGSPPSARRLAWIWLLFVTATGTSLAGLPLASALAVPRVRWATVEAPDLVAPSGEGWRRLPGPAVLVAGPDMAVPTVDAAGNWVLMGLISGKPVPGLPAAEPAPMKPGALRLCPFATPGTDRRPATAGEACRPWPVAWPDPERPISLGELTWDRAGDPAAPFHPADALAYDAEIGLYLRRADPASGAPAGSPVLDLSGRLGGDAPRDGSALLFVLRKVAAGRLSGVRVVGTRAAAAPGGHVFSVQRVDASLTAGRRALTWVVRPILILTSLSLPLGVIALLLAPLIRRRAGASRREAAERIAPALEAAAVISAGLAVAAPAVVAMASLWGSR